jgi:hypothetical protein
MNAAIISMPQQAVPKGMGQTEFDRAQLTAKESLVVMASLSESLIPIPVPLRG